MTCKRTWLGWALSALLLNIAACDDSNSNPDPGDDEPISVSRAGKSGGTTTDSDSKAGSGGKSDGDSGNSSAAGKNAGGSGGKSASDGGKSAAGKSGSGGSGGSGDSTEMMVTNGNCDGGPTGCYCGELSSNSDFLNQCSAAIGDTCTPFDNSKLKKLNPDGTVPPLP